MDCVKKQVAYCDSPFYLRSIKVAQWVHGGAIDDGLEVKMWAGDVARCADISDDLSLADGVANRNVVSAEMRIAGHETAWMLNVDAVAIGGEPGGADNGAALCCIDRIAGGAVDIQPKVEVAEDAADWVDAVAIVGIDDLTVGWPEQVVTNDDGAAAVTGGAVAGRAAIAGVVVGWWGDWFVHVWIGDIWHFRFWCWLWGWFRNRSWFWLNNRKLVPVHACPEIAAPNALTIGGGEHEDLAAGKADVCICDDGLEEINGHISAAADVLQGVGGAALLQLESVSCSGEIYFVSGAASGGEFQFLLAVWLPFNAYRLILECAESGAEWQISLAVDGGRRAGQCHVVDADRFGIASGWLLCTGAVVVRCYAAVAVHLIHSGCHGVGSCLQVWRSAAANESGVICCCGWHSRAGEGHCAESQCAGPFFQIQVRSRPSFDRLRAGKSLSRPFSIGHLSNVCFF